MNPDTTTTGRESPKEMLREIVRDEIRNTSRSKPAFAAIGLSVLGIILSGVAISGICVPPATPLAVTENIDATKETHFHLEKIVGVTTAFMVMADQKQDIIELSYALDIVNKRQATQLGAPLQFTPHGDTQWLNRHMSLTYFNAAVAYLKSADAHYLEILRENRVRNIANINSLPIDEEESLKAQYNLIAILQESLDSNTQADRNLYHDVRSLTKLWTDIQLPGINHDSPEAIINYQTQAERLLRNLNTDVRKP